MCVKSQLAWIRDLRIIVHPEADDHTIFAMIKVYLDESGIHEGATICTVAGYAAPWKKWKTVFVPGWAKVLRKFGLEHCGFHGTNFFPRSGIDYRDWKEEDTVACFNALVNIVNAAELTPIGGSVVTEVFWRLNADERRYITGARYDEQTQKWLTSGAPKTPYHFPVQQAVVDSAGMASSTNKAHFVHDQHKQYAPLVLERFAQLKENLTERRDRLGDFVFSPRMEATPLQAADMMAYQATKYAEQRVETGNPRVEPNYYFRRLMERKNNLRFLDDYAVALLLEGCPPHLRTTKFPSIPDDDPGLVDARLAKHTISV
jgi:hypothetical protein